MPTKDMIKIAKTLKLKPRYNHNGVNNNANAEPNVPSHDTFPHLPASTKERAKPFIKQLATFADDSLVERLTSACAGYLGDDNTDGLVALSELNHVLKKVRAKAKDLGLHRSALDELDAEPLLPPAPIVEEEPTPAVTPNSLSFKERIALRKAGKV